MGVDIAALWWLLILLGLGAGLLSGALGIGAGILVIPALVLFMKVPQKSAQGIALSVMVLMALLGAFQYWRNPEIDVDFRVAALILAGALVGVFGGATLAAKLPAPVLRKLLAVYMLIAAFKLFFPGTLPKKPGESASPHAQQTHSLKEPNQSPGTDRSEAE